MRAGQVWRGRRIAPAHEGPRNESNNKADEPTSDRSTHCGSGHLIRFSVTLSTSFHRYTRAVLFLSRFAHSQGLVALCQTFVLRCHRRSSEPRAQARAMATSSTLPKRDGARRLKPKAPVPAAKNKCLAPRSRSQGRRATGGELERHSYRATLLHLPSVN